MIDPALFPAVLMSTKRSFPAIDAIIRDVERSAVNLPDPLASFTGLLKLIIESDTDPYLLSGALIEGVSAIIAEKIPSERQSDVAIQVIRVLWKRLRERGVT